MAELELFSLCGRSTWKSWLIILCGCWNTVIN